MATLKFGVIGLGVGAKHAAAIAAHPQAELVAICDIDADRLKARTAEFKLDASLEADEYQQLISSSENMNGSEPKNVSDTQLTVVITNA